MNQQESKNLENRIVELVDSRLSFTSRKLTDTPTDSLQVVNRKYVNLNGVTANRPTTSVVGQQYFDTTIGRPLFNNGTNWVDSAGSVV